MYIYTHTGALRRDMAVLVEALAAEFEEKAEETQLKKLDELQAQILRDFNALSTVLKEPEKMSWYETLCDAEALGCC